MLKIDDAQSSDDDEKIKMEDLAELMQQTVAGSRELESPKDNKPNHVSSEDEAEVKTKTKETFVHQSPPPSPRTIKIQELKN
ncbi:hypothetical protein Tco_1120230 [Tanacetum coccineum]